MGAPIGQSATLPQPAAGQPMGETATLIGSGSGGGGYLAALAHSPPVLSPALSPHASGPPTFVLRFSAISCDIVMELVQASAGPRLALFGCSRNVRVLLMGDLEIRANSRQSLDQRRLCYVCE